MHIGKITDLTSHGFSVLYDKPDKQSEQMIFTEAMSPELTQAMAELPYVFALLRYYEGLVVVHGSRSGDKTHVSWCEASSEAAEIAASTLYHFLHQRFGDVQKEI